MYIGQIFARNSHLLVYYIWVYNYVAFIGQYLLRNLYASLSFGTFDAGELRGLFRLL